MKNVVITKYVLTACLLVGMCALIAVAQNKPSFNGTWKLNLQKSKFAGDSPKSVTIEFNHKDNNLTEAFTSSQVGGEHTVEARYNIDGKGSDVPLGDEVIKATTKWEGDALVIDWRGPEAGRYFIRKHTLSADGKAMTINIKRSRPDGGEAEETWVLEKQ
jgi:hypothetical protein